MLIRNTVRVWVRVFVTEDNQRGFRVNLPVWCLPDRRPVRWRWACKCKAPCPPSVDGAPGRKFYPRRRSMFYCRLKHEGQRSLWNKHYRSSCRLTYLAPVSRASRSNTRKSSFDSNGAVERSTSWEARSYDCKVREILVELPISTILRFITEINSLDSEIWLCDVSARARSTLELLTEPSDCTFLSFAMSSQGIALDRTSLAEMFGQISV